MGDAEFSQGLTELGEGLLLTGELLFDGQGFAGRAKDGVPVRVQGDRDAVGENPLTHDLEITGKVFVVTKGRGNDLTGGIVDGGQQMQLRAAVFEPVEGGGVDLPEQAGLRLAGSWAMGLGGTPATTGRKTCLDPDAANGGRADGDLFMFAQEVGEMAVVSPLIPGALVEVQDVILELLGQGMSGLAAAVAVNESLRSMFKIAFFQAKDLTD